MKKNMKKNLTYILGAGASANALPVANQIADTLRKFINFFQRCGGEIDNSIAYEGSEKKLSELKTELLRDINEILDNIIIIRPELFSSMEMDIQPIRSTTFDDFAENLDFNSEKFKRLSTAYSLVMSVEEFYNIDTRYISFTNRIVEGSHFMRDNIKIINWNYDNQLQKSIMQTKKISYFEAYKRLNTIEKYTSFQRKSGSVFRLNGSFNYNFKHSRNESVPFLNDKNKKKHTEREIAKEIVKLYGYCVYHPDCHNLLSLNNDRYTNETKELAINSVRDTQYLVIIGYSFPDLNAETDKEILSSMTKLEKVFIQDLKPNDIKRSFKELYEDKSKFNNEDFFDTPDCSSFYIPLDTIT